MLKVGSIFFNSNVIDKIFAMAEIIFSINNHFSSLESRKVLCNLVKMFFCQIIVDHTAIGLFF